MNENVTIYSRARFLNEQAMLEKIGVSKICYEEAEAAAGIAEMILQEEGADDSQVIEEVNAIRENFAMRGVI
jgi:CPA2 family monovalent cation:H+ antiporter-2